jgi:hypothetical protein
MTEVSAVEGGNFIGCEIHREFRFQAAKNMTNGFGTNLQICKLEHDLCTVLTIFSFKL